MVNTHKGHIASCLCCKFLECHEATPHYSERTPGSAAEVGCREGEFDRISGARLTSNLLQMLHDRGAVCKSFEPKEE